MRRITGFTLIEIAVAILVIALLLGSIFVPLQTQVEQRQISSTEKALDEIREALVGFALVNGYLPCPDTDNDGAENLIAPSNTRCTSNSGGRSHGNIPWGTLGLAAAQYDVWGNRFRYSVREDYAKRDTVFSLSTPPADLRVCPAAGSCGGGQALTSTAVAIILSHGKNGYGATSGIAGTPNPAPSSTDEQENTDSNRDFVHRTHSPIGSTAGEYDDIVAWIPLYSLFNRMVAAGKLP